ncbi:integrase/recombinase xerD homolog isoform X1 [Dreissena polymorpha]|uniref:integrase/recombinase xerD homolog isoform X1 n=1 Tax=Dreissena polymorpha TaxID=45954 RepID=UPI002263F45E|nr:integrase/recombinase xerD homolog isoform X1 [Dreissena polymorpha]
MRPAKKTKKRSATTTICSCCDNTTAKKSRSTPTSPPPSISTAIPVQETGTSTGPSNAHNGSGNNTIQHIKGVDFNPGPVPPNEVVLPHQQPPQVPGPVPPNAVVLPHQQPPQVPFNYSDDSYSEDEVDPPANLQEILSTHMMGLLPDTDREISSFSSTNGQGSNCNSGSSSTAQLNLQIYNLLNSSLAPSTRASYQNALQHYNNFHSTHYPQQPLWPTTTEQLAQFIAVCNARQLKASTITSYISAITYVHKLKGFSNPAESFVIKKLLHSIRRHKNFDRRHPFTPDHLQLLLSNLRVLVSDKYTQVLMRTMFLFAFYGLFRLGELATSSMGFMNVIQRQNLSFTFNGSIVSGVSVLVNAYKHSQGRCATIPLSRQACKQLCPIRAVLRYLRIAPQYPGPLFRFTNGEAISTTFFRTLLHRCVIASNLDPKLFTAHSFRIGGATHAHSNHMSPSQIQQLGRWKSQAYLKYIRPQSLPI